MKDLVRDLVDKVYEGEHFRVCTSLTQLKKLVTEVLGEGPELEKLINMEKSMNKRKKKMAAEAKSWDDWRDSLVIWKNP
jgi:hypothetical protein